MALHPRQMLTKCRFSAQHRQLSLQESSLLQELGPLLSCFRCPCFPRASSSALCFQVPDRELQQPEHGRMRRACSSIVRPIVILSRFEIVVIVLRWERVAEMPETIIVDDILEASAPRHIRSWQPAKRSLFLTGISKHAGFPAVPQVLLRYAVSPGSSLI